MKRTLIALAAAAALPLAALAHEVAKGPNGGPVVDSSGHHVEMVAKGKDLVLYLTEESDKPLASAGAKNARSIIQDGGRRVLSGLAPPPLADEGSIGYRAASHEGGGRGCGAWNADRMPPRSDRSAPPKAIVGSAAVRAASSSTSAPTLC